MRRRRFGWQGPTRDLGLGGIPTGLERLGGSRVSRGALVAEPGIVADIGDGLVEPDLAPADLYPTCRVELEVVDAGLDVDDGYGLVRRPTERAAGAQLIEDFFRQRGVTAQVGMLGIVEERVVKDSMPALGLEDSRAVDQQNSRMAGSHFAEYLPKCLGTAQGHGIALAGKDVVRPRLIPTA